ncbi:MAG: hypothetical protein OEU36_19660 [Gammaproteobacteria bacterium]|nr:hypothetical protein [Gammaproteobacteria bacterium]
MKPRVKDIDRSEGLDIRAPTLSAEQHIPNLHLPWEEQGIKSRFLFKSLAAVMTASLRPKRGFIDHLGSIINPRTSNYDRIGALINSIDTVLPGTAKNLSNLLYRSGRLPVQVDNIKLYTYGTAAMVFLVETVQGRSVVKIYKKSLGNDLDGLMKVADFYKKKYELAKSWYDAPGLVPPTHFVIMPSPVLGSPAAACIQSYIEGEKKDFLNDFTDMELVNLIRQDDALRKQFICFAKQTIHMYCDNELCIDLLGEGNLILAKNDDLVTLNLIDYGIAPASLWKSRSAESYSKIDAYVSRLGTLLQKISGVRGNEILE